LKRTFWGLRAELKTIVVWILGGMPLQMGIWLRARLLPRFLASMGTENIVQEGFRISAPERVSIGSHCNLGADVTIAGGGGVRIGDWVGFGPGTKVWSVNHRFEDPDTPWQLQGWERKPVVIEDDVWLAANVFVMPGVTIGRGAVVSASAVVSRSVPPYALVAGNPGRVVGWRKRPCDDEPGQGAHG
jgi:acetyltransferase-like isoleucine patch superfamily enzyme